MWVFPGLNKVIFTRHLVSLVSRKDSMLVVLVLVLGLMGEKETVQEAPRGGETDSTEEKRTSKEYRSSCGT